MTSEETHKAVVAWYEALGRWDMDAVLNGLAEDLVFEMPLTPSTKIMPYMGTWKGRQGFIDASTIRNTQTQITGFKLRDVVAEGNNAVAWIYSKATCLATKVEFELEVIQWLGLNDKGQIQTVKVVFDPVPEINAFKGRDQFTEV